MWYTRLAGVANPTRKAVGRLWLSNAKPSTGLLRRFYKEASIQEAENGNGWAIMLDDKPLKTPGGSALFAPTKNAAELVAGEWNNQKEFVAFNAMPFSCLAIQALDLVLFKDNRAAVEKETLKFLQTDTLLMLPTVAEADQERLNRLHSEHAISVQQRLEKLYQLTEPLRISRTLDPPSQEPSNLNILALQVRERSPWKLSCLFSAVRNLKSYLLGLALLDAMVPVAQVINASTIEKRFQEERWGKSEEAEKELQLLQMWLSAAFALHRSV